MKNLEDGTAPDKKRIEEDPAVVDPVAAKPEEMQNESAAVPTGFFDRLRRWFNSSQRPPAPTRDFSEDRTRSLLLLIGGTVGAVLLFIGVFSTPPRPSLQETRNQRGPNLGRPAAVPGQPTGTLGSVTPLLNADVRTTDLARDQLSPSDISGTSRRAVEADKTLVPPDTPATRSPRNRPALPSPRPPAAVPPTDAADPLAQYRVDDGTGAPTYRYGVPLPSDPGTRASGTFSYGGAGTAARVGPIGAQSPSRS